MSVMSESFGYEEVCRRSHEFLRRGCSYTPNAVEWAGDMLVFREFVTKQSEVNDMRGGESAVEYHFSAVGDGCGDITVSLPYTVEETGVRNGDDSTFEYLIPKSEDGESEDDWAVGMYQSLSDCGDLMDGGDALQLRDIKQTAVSMCGTLSFDTGATPAQCHYLDNRKSYQEDPDRGLFIAARTLPVGAWAVRYALATDDLSEGLIMSDDVTQAFTAALSALGMTHEDVFEFGMI